MQDNAREKLIKLLMLTQSDNDAECLSAARLANALLKKHGKTWLDFLEDRIVFRSEESKPPRYEGPKYNGPEIKAKIREVLSRKPDNEFYRSLSEFYSRTGFLTAKQYQALFR